MLQNTVSINIEALCQCTSKCNRLWDSLNELLYSGSYMGIYVDEVERTCLRIPSQKAMFTYRSRCMCTLCTLSGVFYFHCSLFQLNMDHLSLHLRLRFFFYTRGGGGGSILLPLRLRRCLVAHRVPMHHPRPHQNILSVSNCSECYIHATSVVCELLC